MSSALARLGRDTVFDETFLRKLERLEIAARKLRAGILRGERRSTKRGQSVEFADFRTYSHGDDLRRVDWNAYARFERAFIKLYHEEEDRTVHLLLDTSASMDWGEPNKLRYAKRLAAALGYVNSRVLLTLMYYLVFTPYGLVSRLSGRDPLRRRAGAGESYWVERKRTRQAREGFERLF